MFYAETTVFSKKILFCFFKTDKNLNSHDILKLIVPFNGIEKKNTSAQNRQIESVQQQKNPPIFRRYCDARSTYCMRNGSSVECILFNAIINMHVNGTKTLLDRILL